MRTQTTLVSIKLGTLRGPLSLKRVPKYLRFVMVGTDWKTLDALDQLDDVPQPNERIIAAAKEYESNVHLDGVRNGRRCGWNERMATYVPVADPPADDVLRDTAKWQAWCYAQPGAPTMPQDVTPCP